jgi:hypothetical protein
MERFGSGFAVNGTRPAPVLRLRRSRPEGGTELADEVSLIRVARERSGDAGFRVGPGLALYHAELGLAAADGGWLMLARSNRLDNAARIGLRLPVSQERSPILEPIGLLPRFPLVEPVQGQPVAASGGTTRRLGDRNALTVEGRGLSLESPAWGPTGDTAPTPPHQPSQTLSIGRALCLDPPPLPSAAMALADSVSIDMLAYEAAPTRTNGLRMDAELRILGAAAPGSLIDLFGHSFQVGPGGRFQLTVRVDDPDLLRRALELHPPPELKAKRDD